MKNLILVILSIFVLYIVSIFLFPTLQLKVSNALRLQDFDAFVVDTKNNLNKYIEENILSKFSEVTNSALEIKQDVTNQVETFSSWVQNVTNKLDEVRTNVNKTTESINSTMNSIWELKDSFWNIVPSWTWTWSIDTQAKIEEYTKKLQQQKVWTWTIN